MTISASYKDEALEWFAIRLSGEINETQRAELRTWQSQSELHRRAYEELVRLWGDLDWDETLNQEAMDGIVTFAPASEKPVRRFVPAMSLVGGLLAACVALAALFISYGSTVTHPVSTLSPIPPETVYQTAIGEVRNFALDDGSEVTLAGQSQLVIKQMDGKRLVELRKGDGYFKISRDASRPFEVETDQLKVIVLGTEFEINSKPDHGEVSVAKGVVEVTSHDLARKVQISVGERAVVGWRGEIETSDFDVSRVANWRDNRLSFVNTSLQELISETNQYYPKGIYLGSRDISELKVTASFRTDQVETAVSGIARSLGLSVIRTEAGALVMLEQDAGK